MRMGLARVGRGRRWLLGFALGLAASFPVPAQHAMIGPEPQRPVKERALPGGYPSEPSIRPSFTIPVEPLGFSPPGPLYLGERISVASLDFIGEDRLLFTFRVPGLIERHFENGRSEQDDARHIRALVLRLPTGTVESDALWTVHDRSRYLWMLDDGHFLLRDRENLLEGDAGLNLKPLLAFPGPLVGIALDPSQKLLVANSLEPAAAPKQAAGEGDGQNGDDAEQQQENYVVRILRRETGQVLLVSRTRIPVRLAINTEGYIENLRGRADQWLLELDLFGGGSRILGAIESNCTPDNRFLSPQQTLAIGCDDSGAIKLVSMSIDGRILWDDVNAETTVWPQIASYAGGKLTTLETLAVTHPVSAYAPLSADDIKGQVLRILDNDTGEMRFESPVSPILDAGGNVAVSPSGRRVAIVNAGAIQVFDLTAAAAGKGPAR